MDNRFMEIIKDIKSVKIQGAENIALAGIKAYLTNPTKKGLKEILKARPTEPLLQNSLRIISRSKNKEIAAKKIVKLIKKAHREMVKNSRPVIKSHMNIYVHCHSSSVIDIIKFAKSSGKKDIVVYTTEVEPLLQGRLTAKELSNSGIKVVLSPDLAAEQMLSKSDIFLFGADAVSKRYLANKIGTKTLCIIAKKYKIPSYSALISMKFAKKIVIEKRPKKEVWDVRKNKISIFNPAFDLVPLNLIDGIISEFGITNPKEFVRKAKENLSNLMDCF